ncbi:MAG TPA: DUF2752 domain-containing protein [Acidimicrobiales bacterium]
MDGPHPTVEAVGHAEAAPRPGVAARLAVVGGLAALTGYVYLADPGTDGVYPACPSRALLGLDCPACGGLRGTHALLHGRIGEALDHNLLLPLLLGGFGVALALWLLPLVGRPERQLRLPTWAWTGLAVLLGAFAVARNLPIDALDYLASDA